MAKERKASVMYDGNASQLVYAFPFDYLRKKFVKVEDIYTNITELTIGVDYTVEDKQVRLVKAIPLGHSVKIYRETTTDPLVEWQDASVLRSADLSLQEVQLLHLAEETSDKVFDSGMSTAYDNPNCWDGQYKRIINALDPIEDGDVVTLRYIKANQDSLLNQLKSTGAAQNASIVSTGDTQNARLTATGDKQNTRLTSTGDTQNKRLTDTGDSYVATMTTLRDTTATKATEANNSADLAKKWAVSTSSPDGATDSKSAKTWAEEAKVSAGNAASSASTAQSSAETSSYYANQARAYAEAPRGQAPHGSTSARVWAETAGSHASAAASSASTAASSASNAATSASNAKVSETNAANSAKVAKQSEENAKTWDPTHYTKTLKMSKPDNHGYNVLILLEEIPDYYTYNAHRCGGSFSIYPYTRTGGNNQLKFPPVHCSLSLPYNTSTNDGYIGWSTNDTYVPIVIKNNNTNKIYWGLSMRGSGHTVLMFGAFEHNISVIDTLLSSSPTDTYDGWTILQKAEIKTIATTADLPTKTSQLTNDSNFAVKSDLPTKTSQLTNDSGFAVISNGHLSINGSELWIE